MGSAEGHIDQLRNQKQLKDLQSATIFNSIDNNLQQDPLRLFLKNKVNRKARMKTLSDVQKEADMIKLKIKADNTESPQDMCKKARQLLSQQPKTDRNPQFPTFQIIKTSKENIQSNLSTISLNKPISLLQKTDSKNSFKNVSIETESFIKIRQESPLLFYDFKEMIGEGGYGQVFKAQCKNTLQLKAIKVLKTKFLKQAQMKGLLAEMTLQSKLNHPSIVTLSELFHYQNLYYVVMEYCNGGSVVQLIKKISPKSELIIANIVKQVFQALSYLHAKNIIHRDIKLQNIVFLNSVQYQKDFIPIKIIDFGAAVKSQYKVVQNYPIAGTLSYLAPEVMKGILTDKSDLWSTGVLMYLLLTGISPFKGKKQLQTKENIIKKELNFNSSPLKLISPEAKDLLQKLLNRNMYKRISAIQALNHPWFSQINTSHEISLTNLKKLESYYVNYEYIQRGNNLISIIESYLSLRKVTQEERQTLARLFTSIDCDGNGLIEKKQLTQILKNNVQHFSTLSDKAIDALVNSIDKDSSGKIDFNEFIIAMYDKKKLYVRQSLNEAFEYFDKDHTGFIEMEELKQILHGGDAAQVEYFIHKIDQDKDKRISREQFISFLLTY